MGNLISGQKVYKFGGEKSTGYVSLKKEYIADILKYPAVVIKGIRNDLITMDLESDPPKYSWIEANLEIMNDVELIMLRNLVEKKFELGSN